ncbi:hypothetical protein IFVP201_C2150055 [Vibrio parahaemolyticus]
MPPINTIAVVILKDVVKIVVTLAKGKEGQDTVITGRIFVRKSLLAPNMRQRVNKEGCVMAQEQASCANNQQHSPNIPIDKT